jgi:hypothetical protein
VKTRNDNKHLSSCRNLVRLSRNCWAGLCAARTEALESRTKNSTEKIQHAGRKKDVDQEPRFPAVCLSGEQVITRNHYRQHDLAEENTRPGTEQFDPKKKIENRKTGKLRSRTRYMNSSNRMHKTILALKCQLDLHLKHRGHCPPSLI